MWSYRNIAAKEDAREIDEEVLPISEEDVKVIIGEHIVDFVTTC